MQEIDIQHKLADWQQRMDKKREAEKQRQRYPQRTGRTDMRP